MSGPVLDISRLMLSNMWARYGPGKRSRAFPPYVVHLLIARIELLNAGQNDEKFRFGTLEKRMCCAWLQHRFMIA